MWRDLMSLQEICSAKLHSVLYVCISQTQSLRIRVCVQVPFVRIMFSKLRCLRVRCLIKCKCLSRVQLKDQSQKCYLRNSAFLGTFSEKCSYLWDDLYVSSSLSYKNMFYWQKILVILRRFRYDGSTFSSLHSYVFE